MAIEGGEAVAVVQLDSVDALELRLRNARAHVTQGVEAEPWGGRTIRFTDPDGNEFLAFDAGGPSPAKSATR